MGSRPSGTNCPSGGQLDAEIVCAIGGPGDVVTEELEGGGRGQVGHAVILQAHLGFIFLRHVN